MNNEDWEETKSNLWYQVGDHILTNQSVWAYIYISNQIRDGIKDEIIAKLEVM